LGIKSSKKTPFSRQTVGNVQEVRCKGTLFIWTLLAFFQT
jgi:hypothetical protein